MTESEPAAKAFDGRADGVPDRGARLVLGPLLRYVGEGAATIWVETDAACEVEVLGHRARTFHVEGRHYAIVVLRGLEPGRHVEYEVQLDGELAWPERGSEFPPSTIRPLETASPLTLAFGSCRATAPHHPPYTRRRASYENGLGIDALRALALRAATDFPAAAPDSLLMLGDQIYADQPSNRALAFARRHVRDPQAPDDQLEDLAEYARAYCAAWGDPPVRWLLSTVPSMMIFDDHEIHDEWKISQAWVDEMRSQPWYERRVVDGLVAYWLYQQLGNLSPAELEQNELLERVRAAGDAAPVLRDFARDADREPGRTRWSFSRDLGGARLLVMDARAGRELTPGRRRLVSEAEWQWVRARAGAATEHVILASSIPFVVGRGLHWLEAWNERVCDGAWGARAARVGESIRRRANLGHWAAFGRSFAELAEFLDELTAGRLGRKPRSVVLLSGDVHHCYLAELGFRGGDGSRAPAWQAVCSGLRKPLDPGEKLGVKAVHSVAGYVVARLLGRAARVPRPSLGWRLREGPLYANQIASLRIDGPRVDLRVETTAGADWRAPRLRTAFRRRLAGSPQPAGDRPHRSADARAISRL